VPPVGRSGAFTRGKAPLHATGFERNKKLSGLIGRQSEYLRRLIIKGGRPTVWRRGDEGLEAEICVICGVLDRLFNNAMTAGLTTTNPLVAPPIRQVHRARDRPMGRQSQLMRTN
jgi:hypothetical protein